MFDQAASLLIEHGARTSKATGLVWVWVGVRNMVDTTEINTFSGSTWCVGGAGIVLAEPG